MSNKSLYLATAEALDGEMAKRIKNHKKERSSNWTTVEEPIKIAEVIKKSKKYDVLLLDCLTLWLSNLLMKDSRLKTQGSRLKKIIVNFIYACKSSKANIVIVSNEVGLGIVPDNPLARQVRDIAGYANQKIAQAADEMYFVAAGIPVKVK